MFIKVDKVLKIVFLIIIFGISSISVCFALKKPARVPVTTDDGAEIGVYLHARSSTATSKDELFVLIHGINSHGDMWYDGEDPKPGEVSDRDWIEKLTANGYDVVVVDKRPNFEDKLGPKGWDFSYEDEAYDVKAAIQKGKEHFNDPDTFNRNYTQAIVVGHSEAALDITAV